MDKNPTLRKSYPDAVRLLAIFMVVLIHSSSPLYMTEPVGSGSFVLCWLLDGIAHAGVPLFVMVSGSLLLDERRQIGPRRAVFRYALPMVGLYFFWSAVYAVVNKCVQPMIFDGTPFSTGMVGETLRACVEGAYHMWYIPMLVGLYLVTPLLRAFVRRDNLPAVRWFLLLSFVFQFLLPTGLYWLKELTGIDWQETYGNIGIQTVLGYPGYYVAGWYVANVRPARRAPVYITGGISLAAMLGLDYWQCVRCGEGVREPFEPLTLFCGVYAAAVFAAFAWESRSDKARPRLAALSRLTFGVYIIHVELQSLLKVILPYDGNAVIYLAVQWLGVTVISFAVCAVLARIPGLRRLIRA